MSTSYAKVKSVAKNVTPRGPKLSSLVQATMRDISAVVGATLGPGGMAVLIERQEDLPPFPTKDGVSVFRSLGFQDATQQVIMEAARDAAVRTASEAGDGTTTATVLAEAIVSRTSDFCAANPRVSPQKVVRRLERAFRTLIEPTVRKASIKVEDGAEGRALLHAVAKVSANGDSELADAVLQCFDLVGDEGNVTIAEVTGPSGYEVERIEGFPVAMGYEESTGKFFSKFINDPGNQRVVMEKPVFIVCNSRISEFQSLLPIFDKINGLWQDEDQEMWGLRHNVVLVATGFSENVIGQLAVNFPLGNTLNIFPLLAPQSPVLNGTQKFLEDVACITGARVLDPLNAPIDRATVADLGFGDDLTLFESTRFRSTIVGYVNGEEIVIRADEIKANIANAESLLDRTLLQERLGKLTGGIAKLKVVGASNSELKEKRDRAEDAVCAVRGAVKYGCLPGGGWMLLKLISVLLDESDSILDQVLAPALKEPVKRLFSNLGYTPDETSEALAPIIQAISAGAPPLVFDCLEGEHVDPVAGGILDSTPAVLEAVRNSLSIASLLGTLGGTVVFARDAALERAEASEVAEWNRNVQGGQDG